MGYSQPQPSDWNSQDSFCHNLEMRGPDTVNRPAVIELWIFGSGSTYWTSRRQPWWRAESRSWQRWRLAWNVENAAGGDRRGDEDLVWDNITTSGLALFSSVSHLSPLLQTARRSGNHTELLIYWYLGCSLRVWHQTTTQTSYFNRNGTSGL